MNLRDLAFMGGCDGKTYAMDPPDLKELFGPFVLLAASPPAGKRMPFRKRSKRSAMRVTWWGERPREPVESRGGASVPASRSHL
jgi:hypothetical protein